MAPPPCGVASPESRALAAWLVRQGGYCHAGIDLLGRLAGGDGEERSVVAVARVEAGALLLRVPGRCALRTSGAVSLARRLAGIFETGDPFWAPYASTLPAQPEAVERWTEEERKLLRGTQVRPAAASMETREDLLVRTRAVRLDDGSWALVPGVDALNDGPAESRATTLEVDGETFEMRAERALEPGDELTHCYDEDADGAELLRRYGFLPAGAKASPKIFEFADVVAAARTVFSPPVGGAPPVSSWERRVDACDVLLGPSGGRCAVSPEDPLPDALASALIALLAGEEDFQNLAAAVDDAAGALPRRARAKFWTLDPPAALNGDAPLVARVAAALAALAENAQAGYAADAAFAAVAAEGGRSARRAAAARRLRDSEVAACRALLAAAAALAPDSDDDDDDVTVAAPRRKKKKRRR